MVIYRALPVGRYNKGDVTRRNGGRRLPGNVPYLVDNLWEYTRPAHLPSRRHAVYGNTTPELALQNAMGDAPQGFAAWRLEFATPPAVFQLAIPDARTHADIRAVTRFVNRQLDQWTSLSLAEKLPLAPLFVPGITKEELAAAMQDSALLREVVEGASKVVTIWQTDQAAVAPTGELFFELTDGNTATLRDANG